MKIYVLFFLLLLACMYPSLAQGTYENCCLKYGSGMRASIKKKIVSYRFQQTDGGCNIPAIVLKTKKAKTFCADPSQQWVQEMLKNLKQEK
ncbi:C-C motif chemokine 25b [Pygocentrus nattereri]|uniref:Chemokine (C-C motif) ligand 25b n=1 Tax=Pygocentrus nattereri TaxID=42514 RepID=A0AAR2L1C4_PYGNA|nr:C-C motif chemokine 25b [Pygocentrus nattereri]